MASRLYPASLALKAGALWRAGLRTALAGLVAFLPAQNAESTSSLKGLEQPYFIENKGQWPEAVLFLARLGGLDFWITREGMNLNFFQRREVPPAGRQREPLPAGKFEDRDYELVGHRVILRLVGANPSPVAEGREQRPGYHNYFIGRDPRRHASFVRLYGEVVVREVYPGVDMRYYFEGGRVRFDWVVRPGAEAERIRLEVEGADRVEVDGEGRLRFWMRFGESGLADLRVYQGADGRAVPAHFVQEGGMCAIALGPYDHTQTLVIDPLVYATYLGGSQYDRAYGIAVDDSDYVYIAGITSSEDFGTTPGAFQKEDKGSDDVFVVKLNARSGRLVYATYVGGKGEDWGLGMTVDGNGNVYAVGSTLSDDFPVTTGALQGALSLDGFAFRLNQTGSALEYATYLGGSDKDVVHGIAVDKNGYAWVTGVTHSKDFPVTSGVFQATHGGEQDAFVAKLDTRGTGLVYATYLGGSGSEAGHGIAVDENGNAWVTGWTESSDFPLAPNALRKTNRDTGDTSTDAFVVRLDSSGRALMYATYLGGEGEDVGYAIALDKSGCAYVTGFTKSTDFPVTPGALQPKNQGVSDAFLVKLSATGDTLLFATYLGGDGEDRAYAIAVDRVGQTYITGWTWSEDFPVTSDAFQKKRELWWDVFLAKVDKMGRTLIYATYLGGDIYDMGWSIAVDRNGHAWIAGETWSSDFDITAGALRRTRGDHPKAFLAKFCPGKDVRVSLASGVGTDRQTVCVNNPIKAIVYRMPGASKVIAAGLPQGVSVNFLGETATIEGTPMQAGTFAYTIVPENGCGAATGMITVRPNTIITLTSGAGTDAQTVCVNTALTPITYTLTEATGATVRGLPAGVTGRFENGTLTISGTPTEAGTFTYTVTPVGGCGSAEAKGSIKVRPNTTAITLTSPSRMANQKVRVSKPIKPITYSVVDATGAVAKGLPPGVTGTYAGGVFTISGTPKVAGVFSYEVLPVGGCGDVKGTGLITVRP